MNTNPKGPRKKSERELRWEQGHAKDIEEYTKKMKEDTENQIDMIKRQNEEDMEMMRKWIEENSV